MKNFFKRKPKVLKVLIFLCFFYQFYDLTNDYLNYNYFTQLDVGYTDEMPAITLCLNRINIITNNHLASFQCMIGNRNCFSFKTYMRLMNNTICYTFNDSLYSSLLNSELAIYIKNFLRVKLIWHNINDQFY